MASLPCGPLPADYQSTIADVIKDVGVSVLNMPTLRKRLEAKYGISFSEHDTAVLAYVKTYMQSPEIKRELAKAKKAAEGGAIGGKGKRGRSEKAEKVEKKGRKEKKPDDYPKAALSAYIIFGNENRERVKAENPDAKITEILAKIGEAWKAAPESKKGLYRKRAEEDRERYEREMAKYLAAGGSVHKRGGTSGKKEKDPNAPKRALSAYMYFANDFRIKNPNMSMTEQMKAAGAAWKALNDHLKSPYEAKAAKDKERYEREKAAYGN